MQKKHVIAFTYPSSLNHHLSNIKVQFLSKNTNSKLHMLDAGITSNWNCINSSMSKYRKRFARNVVFRIDTGKTASDFVKEVDVLREIQ